MGWKSINLFLMGEMGCIDMICISIACMGRYWD